jgi:hypothetical protein
MRSAVIFAAALVSLALRGAGRRPRAARRA